MENFDLYTDGLWIVAIVLTSIAVGFAWTYRAALWHVIMSRRATNAPARSAEQVVLRPVGQTGMAEHTTPPAPSGMHTTPGPAAPDMDAPNGGMDWEMPRVSAYLSDDAFITMLAAQKLRDGKYRMSANQIVAATKGDRNHVLAIVRQIREPNLAQQEQQIRTNQARLAELTAAHQAPPE